jgi:hypothetical protein
VDADLGLGNDVLDAQVATTLSLLGGSGAQLRARGGPGNDRLSLTRGSAATLLGQQGGLLDVDLNGGAGADVLGVDLWGDFYLPTNAAVLRVRADGGAGNDVVEVALGGRTGSAPRFDVSVTGGVGNDTVAFDLENAGANAAANYEVGTAFVDGSLGVDSCRVLGNGRVDRRNCEVTPTARRAGRRAARDGRALVPAATVAAAPAEPRDLAPVEEADPDSAAAARAALLESVDRTVAGLEDELAALVALTEAEDVRAAVVRAQAEMARTLLARGEAEAAARVAEQARRALAAVAGAERK